jgi:hypothetical protein
LFGTTVTGAANGNGAAFQLTFGGSLVNYTVFYRFFSSNYPDGLVADGAGDVFG